MKHENFNRTGKIFLMTLMFLASTAFASAQVAQGCTYKLDQSVIAGGGGTSADGAGNLYSLTGAIGQAVADTTGVSSASYKIQSGFFTAAHFVPTAANVTIGGRVLTADGRGIRNVILMLTEASGKLRTVTTSAFGYYRFSEVAAGATYIITARGKRFIFVQPTQVVNVNEDASEVNFIGIPGQ